MLKSMMSGLECKLLKAESSEQHIYKLQFNHKGIIAYKQPPEWKKILIVVCCADHIFHARLRPSEEYNVKVKDSNYLWFRFKSGCFGPSLLIGWWTTTGGRSPSPPRNLSSWWHCETMHAWVARYTSSAALFVFSAAWRSGGTKIDAMIKMHERHCMQLLKRMILRSQGSECSEYMSMMYIRVAEILQPQQKHTSTARHVAGQSRSPWEPGRKQKHGG